MALARYESVAVNLAGDVIPNATVEVREDRPGRPVVPLWADRNGTVPLGNPITTDSEGKFGFHVTGGSYYIRVFTGPSQQPLQQYVRRYQAIGTAAERDVEDLATALEAGTATFSTLADLELFVPIVEGVGGKVTTGPDAGFYHYDDVADAWVFDRPLYDSLARMNVTGGTADAILAETATGVADSAVVMLWIEAPGDNTGSVTINGKEVLTASGNSLIAGQWNEGRTYWFSDEGANYKLRTESDVGGIAIQVEMWANETLDNKNYSEEWAQSNDPISVDAGGDGISDKSAKAWAEDADNSAALAAGYAAGVNLPAISPGDGGKQLFVSEDEGGYDLGGFVEGDGIAIDRTVPTAPIVAMADMANATFKGRASLGLGAPEDLTVAQARELLAIGYPPGHLYNLTLSNTVADAANDIDIAVGACRDIADTANIVLTSGMTKRLDAAWAVGSGNGGLDAGAKANSTWYHLFAIRRPDTGVCDVLFSTSPTSPVLPTSYTQKRRIGAVFVGAGGIIKPFLQIGGNFQWHAPAVDANLSAMTADVAFFQALTVPLGIKVIADMGAFPRLTGQYFAMRDPDLAGVIDTTFSVTFSPDSATGTDTGGAQVKIWTNAARQVQCVATGPGVLLLLTRGWYDPRDTYQ